METTKKRHIVRNVLIAIVILAGIVIVGMNIIAKKGNAAYESFVLNEKSTVISKVDSFIKKIGEGKSAEAYEMTDKQNITQAEFENKEFQKILSTYEGQDPEFRALKVVKLLSGNEEAIYQTTISFTDKTSGQMAVKMVKVNGEWKVSVFQLATPPDKIW